MILKNFPLVLKKRWFSFASSPWNHISKGSNEIRLTQSQTLYLEYGSLARFNDSSCLGNIGNSSVLVTIQSDRSEMKPPIAEGTQLMVSYKQKSGSYGKIPLNFLRRDVKESDNTILTGRAIDRCLRPLFPKYYPFETQVDCSVLADDAVHDLVTLSINTASLALARSSNIWKGPIGAVRVILIENDVVLNPLSHQRRGNSANIILAARPDGRIVMVESSSNNISLTQFKKVFRLASYHASKIACAIENIANKSGNVIKRTWTLPPLPSSAGSVLFKDHREQVNDILSDYQLDKVARDKSIFSLRDSIISNLATSFPDLHESALRIGFQKLLRAQLSRNIFLNGIRCDGRHLDDIRFIECKAGLFDPLHGSAIFTRGQTQVLATLAFDSPQASLKLDPITSQISGDVSKRFMLHYEFPALALGEHKSSSDILKGRRREIGHGALAERSIKPSIPKDHPFTIQISAEVLESSGSSSMATVCASSLALLDAGVELVHGPVAGVAMGLLTVPSKGSEEIDDYRILTDILGFEDFNGDMDCKIAGTSNGFTAVQLDLKIPGIPLNILFDTLDKAQSALKSILDKMNECISQPRVDNQHRLPVTENLEVPPSKRSALIGPGGLHLKKLENEYGLRVTAVDEKTFSLFASNPENLKEAKEFIEELIKHEDKVQLVFGAVYVARIEEIRDYGVLVTLYPGMRPTLLHNSQLDTRKITHPSALKLEVGQDIKVKYFGRDPASGEMRISRKVLSTTGGNMRETNFHR